MTTEHQPEPAAPLTADEELERSVRFVEAFVESRGHLADAALFEGGATVREMLHRSDVLLGIAIACGPRHPTALLGQSDHPTPTAYRVVLADLVVGHAPEELYSTTDRVRAARLLARLGRDEAPVR